VEARIEAVNQDESVDALLLETMTWARSVPWTQICLPVLNPNDKKNRSNSSVSMTLRFEFQQIGKRDWRKRMG